MPVAVVGYEAGGGEGVAEIRGGYGEGVVEVAALTHEQTAALISREGGQWEWGTDLQSKLVNSHLCMFMSKLSKCSNPAVRCWYSSQINAAPAYAASTWTQICG